jgi:branched-chain amino acid aminotransferase
MVTGDTKPSMIWNDGRLISWDEATTHVLTHALHYGSGVFEGIRAYDTDGGTAVFRMRDHFARLLRSARAYEMPLLWSVDDLSIATKEVLGANHLGQCYIRPIAFFELGALGLDTSRANVRTVIAAWQWGAYLGDDGVRNGIRARVSSWRRFPRSAFPNAKASGTYINSILAKTEAVRSGYHEAIMLNDGGTVSEATGENLFTVHDGVISTPPLSAGCLDGITRDTVITLLRDAGHTVAERDLEIGDLATADEVFLTGTAAEVTPVREIDDRPVGDGTPGPVTRWTQQTYADVVRGRSDEYRSWLDYV